MRKRDVVVTEDDDSWCEISPGVNCDEGGTSRSTAGAGRGTGKKMFARVTDQGGAGRGGGCGGVFDLFIFIIIISAQWGA